MTEPLAVRSADPRDSKWEEWNPTYRVHFWRQIGESAAWISRVFELKGGDATSVFEWAASHADGDPFTTIFVVVGRDGTRGTVRIAGFDPTHVDARTE